MKKLSALFCGLLLAALSPVGMAAENNYKIDKVTVAVLPTPMIQFTGEQRTSPTKVGQWIEIEVTFTSTAPAPEDITVKYYVQIGNQLLTGEVAHTSVAPGRELHSVMYISPRSLNNFLEGKPVTAALIDNAAAQIVVNNLLAAERYVKINAPPQWFKDPRFVQTPGVLLNKDQTPFAPLYWERYEVIKPK